MNNPSTAKPPKPTWMRVLIWLGIIYGGLTVFSAVMLIFQNNRRSFGSMVGLAIFCTVAYLGYKFFKGFTSTDTAPQLSDNYGSATFHALVTEMPFPQFLTTGRPSRPPWRNPATSSPRATAATS